MSENLPLATTAPRKRRPHRKATAMDRVRVGKFVERVEAGEEELDAFWAVASDAGYGLSRYRDAPERPSDAVLRHKLTALLERAAPEAVAAARDLALVRLAGLSDAALAALMEVLTGECADGRAARARLDAAKTVLGSIGIGERAGITIATQVNIDRAPLAGVPEGA